MDVNLVRDRIASFPRWHYEIDLNGQKTPIVNPDNKNRHQQRYQYFFEPLLQACGGSLKGKRVLDLGCNAGFWSLCAAENECDFVLGIDGRQMHVDQANFVFQVKEIETTRYRFLKSDVYEVNLAEHGPFDIVLCLGLLYHVANPIELFLSIAKANTDILLVDTALAPGDDVAFRVFAENIAEPRNTVRGDLEMWSNKSIKGGLVLWPTLKAVTALASAHGYRGAVLKPEFTDYKGAADFRDGWRRAFLFAKETDLDKLEIPVEGQF